MSKTIYVPIKSVKSFNQIKDFLRKNITPPSKLFNSKIYNEDHVLDGFPFDESPYGKLDLGIEFSTYYCPDRGKLITAHLYDIEYYYIYGLIFWMADRAGRKCDLLIDEKDESVKYIRVNGQIEIFENHFSYWKSTKPSNFFLRIINGMTQKNIDLVKNEINRLNDLYDKDNDNE